MDSRVDKWTYISDVKKDFDTPLTGFVGIDYSLRELYIPLASINELNPKIV